MHRTAGGKLSSKQNSGSTKPTGFLLKPGQDAQHYLGTKKSQGKRGGVCEQSAGEIKTETLSSEKSVKCRTKQLMEI